jgi:hypothetical protein
VSAFLPFRAKDMQHSQKQFVEPFEILVLTTMLQAQKCQLQGKAESQQILKASSPFQDDRSVRETQIQGH